MPLLKDLVKLNQPDFSKVITNNSAPIIQFNLNGGTITPEAMPQFNKWKADITSEVSKAIIDASRPHR